VIPELGNFALIIALCFALIQALGPCYAYYQHANKPLYFSLSIIAAIGQFIFLCCAMLCLIISFLNNDMTLMYVQQHSHQLLPFIYRIGAAWGGHEGSLLLWCLILSGWTLAFIIFSARSLATHTSAKIILLLGFISSGFLIFLFFTSSPFQRIFPTTPIVGDDLTPVLQDPGLIFHPPMLYLGYVGFAIAFAFAICALLEGKFNKTWAATLRPWVVLPWAFLSCGIVLGSWWAYRELGWGGWWFWDPVENASLLPWLSATALIHALLVSEKRDVFKGWTLLLALVTFTLSLLGTFLVRSGVLVSVHAFANDPTRGIFLLAYLAIIIGGGFICYAARIKYFYRTPHFSLFSRETFLLVNSIILLTAVATICLGTLYPLVLDALNLGKISVGEPYFNAVFLPIILPLLFLMGFAPHVRWNKDSFSSRWKTLRLNLFICFVLAFCIPYLCGFEFRLLASIGIFFSIWIITATFQYGYQLIIMKKKIALSQWSMIVAHLGIAVLALGVTVNKSYSEERQVKISVGDTVSLAQYHFTLVQMPEANAANYKNIRAIFEVRKNQQTPQVLVAEQRIYKSHDQLLSKPGILCNVWRDLYLALGSPLPNGAWSIRIYYKPLVRWIWGGGLMLLIGGLLSLLATIKRGRT
jgi:cytochrome c-type biogenesis protein CcmF